jgi:hypothetical protein
MARSPSLFVRHGDSTLDDGPPSPSSPHGIEQQDNSEQRSKGFAGGIFERARQVRGCKSLLEMLHIDIGALEQ